MPKASQTVRQTESDQNLGRHLRRNIDAAASKRARKLLRGDEARRLYDEAALLANYAGPELVARDSVAIFLDWDVTIAVYLTA